ncbi:GntR family transcriptional regulator [Paludibacterium denitrificans]|uniref:GntR family transcriptional regulator n=1 Tax=Paludibacterium denitrificans TaxID=2675226 RepID=UPI0028A69FD0|nr:GntR family transcriptional regulator [Paludibacterium denitrificans]
MELKQPLYAQIKQLLTQRICAGEWSAAEALPSEWELAEQMSVSQGTVRKALTELVGEGVLYRQQGRGDVHCGGSERLGGWSSADPGVV